MRTRFMLTLAAGTLALGACASPYGGGGLGGGDLLGGILGGILGGGGSGSGYGNASTQQFQQAAVNACGQEASRYGPVSIDRAQQTSQSIVQVQGRINTRDSNRDEFLCAFRSDGRITDFRLA